VGSVHGPPGCGPAVTDSPRDELHRPQADHEAILRTLLEFGVRFVLVGGLAVRVHGYPRSTLDVDVMPDPSAGNLRKLAAALRALEAQAVDARGRRLPLDLSHPESLSVGNHFLHTRAGGLDLFNGPRPDLHRYREIERGALEIQVGGEPVQVIGLDDLIRLKREAGREKDLRDIAAIEEVRRRSAESD
jgi:hypothetical protein